MREALQIVSGGCRSVGSIENGSLQNKEGVNSVRGMMRWKYWCLGDRRVRSILSYKDLTGEKKYLFVYYYLFWWRRIGEDNPLSLSKTAYY